MDKIKAHGRAIRVGTALLSTMAFLGLLEGISSAATYTSAADVVSPASSALKTQLLAVAGGAAVLGIVIVAVKKGWRLAKGFFS
jgi:hypothetical protein